MANGKSNGGKKSGRHLFEFTYKLRIQNSLLPYRIFRPRMGGIKLKVEVPIKTYPMLKLNRSKTNQFHLGG